MSRAFGNKMLKQFVVADPEIQVFFPIPCRPGNHFSSKKQLFLLTYVQGSPNKYQVHLVIGSVRPIMESWNGQMEGESLGSSQIFSSLLEQTQNVLWRSECFNQRISHVVKVVVVYELTTMLIRISKLTKTLSCSFSQAMDFGTWYATRYVLSPIHPRCCKWLYDLHI